MESGGECQKWRVKESVRGELSSKCGECDVGETELWGFVSRDRGSCGEGKGGKWQQGGGVRGEGDGTVAAKTRTHMG